MRGAVAAGHPLSAQAGARILAEGGNAVDACVAAAFAGTVCEGLLTSLGGGGFMLVHRAADRATRLADFFVTVPGLGARRPRGGRMDEVHVRFGDGATTQPFRIGPASVAVPGAVAGLEAVHRAYGRLPWCELVAPACELARGGVTVTPAQAHVHTILDPIVRSDTEASRVFSGSDGGRLRRGERLRLPDLAETLERVGRSGARALSGGELAHACVDAVAAGGGELTLADLASYRVVWRRPVGVRFAGHTVLSNPPPSSGGVLVAYGLALLDGMPLTADTSAAAIAGVMRELGRTRGPGSDRALRRGGLARRLLSESSVAAGRARIAARATGVREVAPPSGTTHVSVLDADGNAASLSTSTGSGSGVVVPGTGIYLNNMLGEYDLVGPLRPPAGTRLTSMMAPTIVLSDGGHARLVLGSAGSVRLRGAILQVVVNVLTHRLGVAEAIDAPRIHVEEPVVHCEGGQEPAALHALAQLGYDLVRWRRRNLFFGGVAAVELSGTGLAAAGDPRRGGAGIVVDALARRAR